LTALYSSKQKLEQEAAKEIRYANPKSPDISHITECIDKIKMGSGCGRRAKVL
jgi:hypothetical protein